MRLNLYKINWLIATIVLISLNGYATENQKKDNLKVAFVYVTPISDAGWTKQHDIGREQLEAALGDQVEVKTIDSVGEGAEAERVIHKLAASGNDLIFTTSFGYMNPTIKVAKSFSNTLFEHATGYKKADNVGNYVARFYEGRYLTGMVAGAMSQSNTLGYVAAFPIPEVVRGINAFTRGAQSLNPDIAVKVIWVNSWFDPGREREAAEALITHGADVLTHHTDSTSVVATAEDKGVWAVAYHSDMSHFGKEAHLTAATHHWGEFYIQRAKEVLDDKWTSQSVWGGLAEGMIDIAPINQKVPADVVAKVNETKEQIRMGAFHPFAGPVINQAGEVIVSEAETMTDQALATMDYYVQGVEGSLPK